MRYEVRVPDGSHFNYDRHELLAVGDLFTERNVTYRVTAIQELNVDRVDAIAEVEQVDGPPVSG